MQYRTCPIFATNKLKPLLLQPDFTGYLKILKRQYSADKTLTFFKTLTLSFLPSSIEMLQLVFKQSTNNVMRKYNFLVFLCNV